MISAAADSDKGEEDSAEVEVSRGVSGMSSSAAVLLHVENASTASQIDDGAVTELSKSEVGLVHQVGELSDIEANSGGSS